jgi:hypothetical protein
MIVAMFLLFVLASGQIVVSGLSYVDGVGVGDRGFLTVGAGAPFSLVTRAGVDVSANCIDLSRIIVQIKGPQDQLVGFRFTSACENGEYQLAWLLKRIGCGCVL